MTFGTWTEGAHGEGRVGRDDAAESRRSESTPWWEDSVGAGGSLRRVKKEPYHSQFILSHSAPWRRVQLPMADIPGMISEEEKRYYRWIGASYTGIGEPVELGSWLGCSTRHIVAGLQQTSAFVSRRLNVFDDFVWRSEWMDGRYDSADLPDNHDDFQFIFERHVEPVSDLLDVHKARFADTDGNAKVPRATWDGRPIELIYVDLGRTLEQNEAWWRVFESAFIPNKTLVMMQDWQLFKERPKRWFNQTKDFTDSKGSALELVHELRGGTLAAFLFRGDRALHRSRRA